MKRLLSILMFVLLLLSLAVVHASETEIDQEGTPGEYQIPEGVRDRLVDPMGQQRHEVKPGANLPSKDAEGEVLYGDRQLRGGTASSGLIDTSNPPGGSVQIEIIDPDEMNDMIDSHTFVNFGGTTQKAGVDHCEKEELIVIADDEEFTALEKFQMSLDAAWNSENPDETLCFEFPEPVILSSPLIIARPDPAISLNLKLVGMNFEAAPTFRADNSAKPIVHVHNTGGAKLELVDLKVKGPSDHCLKIENSSDIIVQRGELKECQIGALVFGSQGIHFGAYGYQYVDADGVYIGQNKEKGISVHRSDRVTFGYNKFDINVQPEDAEAVPIFDYYNAVSLEALANAGIEKPKPMPFVPGADDYARLVIDDINEPQFLSFMYDNPPGSVQLYSTVSGEVKFVGACELGEDKKCHAHVQSEWFCPSGMMLTAIYTSSALEASSEFMTPIQCSFFVVKPQETEFVMATPSSGASGEVSVEGASVTPAAKMCTLMPKASVTYAPLMWLFLSVGVLGAVRRRHRK